MNIGRTESEWDGFTDLFCIKQLTLFHVYLILQSLSSLQTTDRKENTFGSLSSCIWGFFGFVSGFGSVLFLFSPWLFYVITNHTQFHAALIRTRKHNGMLIWNTFESRRFWERSNSDKLFVCVWGGGGVGGIGVGGGRKVGWRSLPRYLFAYFLNIFWCCEKKGRPRQCVRKG